MFKFSWNPAWEVGHREIDRQHRELFSRMVKLADAIEQGGEFAEMERTLLQLGDYVETHFAMEEGLMVAAGYSGLEPHRDAHDAMRERVRSLVQDYLEGRQALPMEVMDFLISWLVDHLGSEDRRMAAHLHVRSL